MSIETELTKLQTNLSNSYAQVQNRGGTIPQIQNFDNLSTAISTITSREEVESEISTEIDLINGEAI